MSLGHRSTRQRWAGRRKATTEAKVNQTTNTTIDSDTGEILSAPSRQRKRRELTPEETAVREERASQKRRMLDALEALSPALVANDDPPVRDLGLIDVSKAKPRPPLVRLSRPSGRGGPGTSLIVTERNYDGDNGGEPGPYALLYAEFHDGGSHRCRTRGVAVRRAELRRVADALRALADDLDAGDRIDAAEEDRHAAG